MRAMIGALGLASALSGSRRLRAARSGLRKMVAAFGEVQGGTALHAAAARNDLRLAKALLEAGVDPTVRDEAGRTALGVVRERHGADGMATALFERALGPDPSALDERRAQRAAALSGGGGARWALLLAVTALVGGGVLVVRTRR